MAGDSNRLQMWFEQFRDLAVINLALAGGVITLLGAGAGAFMSFAVRALTR